ncbi:MAG: hypothetical protein KA436_11275 [Oligoflexales bacterium]|nr:hypothetical protein [Oligoflexales bacterium]
MNPNLGQKTGASLVLNTHCVALGVGRGQAVTAYKRKRAMLSSFAYKKFFSLLAGKAKKEGVRVKQINPAYTSVIGFYKFQGYSIYTTHELAALAIARRGL